MQNNNSNNVPSPQQQPGAPVANNNALTNSTAGTNNTPNAPSTNNPSTKQQLEQLNTMREALFSPDGWGCVSLNNKIFCC